VVYACALRKSRFSICAKDVRAIVACGFASLAAAVDSAPTGTPDAALSPVVVTATRLAQSSFDLPVAIDRVERIAIRQGQWQVNLSESLDAVPGASVESRQNYAQDLQISIRGFGARSSFGVRGVRLYSDGIPERCRMARASFRSSIWVRPITSK
jgi:iron complex outermembrane recepter protein